MRERTSPPRPPPRPLHPLWTTLLPSEPSTVLPITGLLFYSLKKKKTSNPLKGGLEAAASGLYIIHRPRPTCIFCTSMRNNARSYGASETKNKSGSWSSARPSEREFAQETNERCKPPRGVLRFSILPYYDFPFRRFLFPTFIFRVSLLFGFHRGSPLTACQRAG